MGVAVKMGVFGDAEVVKERRERDAGARLRVVRRIA